MMDKTKNMFTCGEDGERYPVCRHVRAWVRTEMAAQYDRGYRAGVRADRRLLRQRVKKLKEPSELPRHLFTVEERVQQDYGYMCAKDDILGGLE